MRHVPDDPVATGWLRRPGQVVFLDRTTSRPTLMNTTATRLDNSETNYKGLTLATLFSVGILASDSRPSRANL